MLLRDCFSNIDREKLIRTVLIDRHGTAVDTKNHPQRQMLENLLDNIANTLPDTDTGLILIYFHAWDEDGPYIDLRFYRIDTLLRDTHNIFPYNHMTAYLDDTEPGLVKPRELDRLGICAYLDYRQLLPQDIPWRTLRLQEVLGAQVFPPCPLLPETLLQIWLTLDDPPCTPSFSEVANCYQEDCSPNELYNAVSAYRALQEVWPQFTDYPFPQPEAFSPKLRTSRDGQFTYRYFGNGRILLEDYLGSRKVLELPKTLDGFRVLPVIRDGSFSDCTTVEVIVVRQAHVAFGISTFCNCTIRKVIGIRPPEETDCRIDPYYLRFYGTFDCRWDRTELIWPSPDDMPLYCDPQCVPQLLLLFAKDDADAVVDCVNSWDQLPF